MCFFISQSKAAAEIARKYGRQTEAVEAARAILAEKESRQEGQENIYNYRITDGMYVSPAYAEPITVIVSGSSQLEVMRWGLIPGSAKPEAKERYNKQNLYKNAKAENLFTTWPWRNLWQYQRCIIPVTGFFETHYHSDGTKQPYFIQRSDKQIFSIAGLYDEWKDPETGESYKSFVMITVPATPKLREIHNGGAHPFRMPLIIPDNKVEDWLNSATTEKEEIIKYLITPEIDREMVAWPVKSKYNWGDPYNPATIEKVPSQEKLDL
ncbi:MAG: SOS response-associated peptidase [Bacteroidales bacterium]|nr:SOS response-associated peptidase [Bacteroidales bacterium]